MRYALAWNSTPEIIPPTVSLILDQYQRPESNLAVWPEGQIKPYPQKVILIRLKCSDLHFAHPELLVYVLTFHIY